MRLYRVLWCAPLQNYIIVFRLEKLKPKLPKLNIVPANEAIDPSCIVRRPMMAAASPTPSPSPSPVPQEYIDPDFDPDNVVIRGAPTDDEDDDDDGDNRTDAKGGNGMSDFTFNTHSWVSVRVCIRALFIYVQMQIHGGTILYRKNVTVHMSKQEHSKVVILVFFYSRLKLF